MQWGYSGLLMRKPYGNGKLNPDYDINEIKYDEFVEHCSVNITEFDPTKCAKGDGFVQAPREFTTYRKSGAISSEYGFYWGRDTIQVTCHKGRTPDGGDYCPAYSGVGTYFSRYFEAQGWPADVMKTEPWRVAMDATLAWGSAMIYWMTNNGHDDTGYYSCHQWIQLKDFAGTIEVINGGWGGGEAPLDNNCQARIDSGDTYKDGEYNHQQKRIKYFKQACESLDLDPEADGYNGLSIEDKVPCELYFRGVPKYYMCSGWKGRIVLLGRFDHLPGFV